VEQDAVASQRNVIAWKRLDLVLSFFGRADTRLSLVFGVDVGVLGYLVAHAPRIQEFQWFMALAAIPVGLIGRSLWHVYLGFFPQLKGGAGSLIYFREIAKLPQESFVEQVRVRADEAELTDLLQQVWRNSQILTDKFDHLKSAFELLAWAIAPWLVSLELFLMTR
jgi:hypothetical protein